MEPITLIVTALTTAAGLIAKSVLGEAAKDAYKKLRDRLIAKHAGETDLEMAVTAIEKQPDSRPRQALLAEELAKTPAPQDAELLQLAQKVVDALQALPEGRIILTKYHITNSNIGFAGDHAHIEGGIHIGQSPVSARAARATPTPAASPPVTQPPEPED